MTPVYSTAKEISPHESERGCTCCERTLTGHAVRWLEFDQRTWTYHDFGGVPEGKSQGWFAFGITCAKRELKKAKAAIAKAEGAK